MTRRVRGHSNPSPYQEVLGPYRSKGVTVPNTGIVDRVASAAKTPFKFQKGPYRPPCDRKSGSGNGLTVLSQRNITTAAAKTPLETLGVMCPDRLSTSHLPASIANKAVYCNDLERKLLEVGSKNQ